MKKGIGIGLLLPDRPLGGIAKGERPVSHGTILPKNFVNTGVYARVKKLAAGELCLVYSQGPTIWIRKSTDEGQSWLPAIKVSEDERYNYTNSELLQLQKRLVALYMERPSQRRKQTRIPDHGSHLQRPGRDVGSGTNHLPRPGKIFTTVAGSHSPCNCPMARYNSTLPTSYPIPKVTSRRLPCSDRSATEPYGALRRRSLSEKGRETVCPWPFAFKTER